MTHWCYFGSGIGIFGGGRGRVWVSSCLTTFQWIPAVWGARRGGPSVWKTACVSIPLFNKRHLTKHQRPSQPRGMCRSAAIQLLNNTVAHEAQSSSWGPTRHIFTARSALMFSFFCLPFTGSDPINLLLLLQTRQRNYRIILHIRINNSII